MKGALWFNWLKFIHFKLNTEYKLSRGANCQYWVNNSYRSFPIEFYNRYRELYFTVALALVVDGVYWANIDMVMAFKQIIITCNYIKSCIDFSCFMEIELH